MEGRLKRDLQSSLFFHGVTLYVAAHHAAVDSTDFGFLSVLHPQVSVVSVGRNNQFGYPSGESMKILKKYSRAVMRTDMDGEVCFALHATVAISCKQ
ncbi:MAG TPA: hypothetical protein EYG88_01100 [Desulfocapsa sulfexigens]|nr:hypothetical protein [Desulfocapsa sulfexigens]